MLYGLGLDQANAPRAYIMPQTTTTSVAQPKKAAMTAMSDGGTTLRMDQ
jgi:hypothetical protein